MDDSKPVILPRTSFAVAVQQVNSTSFSDNKRILSANFGDSFRFRQTSIESENLEFGSVSSSTRNSSTASIELPNNLFLSVANTSETTRIAHSIFLNDALFLRRTSNIRNRLVGSIIMSASIAGIDRVSNILEPPVLLGFLKNPVRIKCSDNDELLLH